jgi:hypothetical protein
MALDIAVPALVAESRKHLRLPDRNQQRCQAEVGMPKDLSCARAVVMSAIVVVTRRFSKVVLWHSQARTDKLEGSNMLLPRLLLRSLPRTLLLQTEPLRSRHLICMTFLLVLLLLADPTHYLINSFLHV